MSIFNAPPQPVKRVTSTNGSSSNNGNGISSHSTPSNSKQPPSSNSSFSSTTSTSASITAPEKDPDLKIILLGDSAVGKSKLVERFLMNDYAPRQMSTYALTVFRHTQKAAEGSGQKDVEVDFWDTAGQERFNSMHPSYYYRAHACILVFDVTRKVTYQHLQEWYDELQQHRPGLPTLVVANKIDVDISVTKQSFKFPLKNSACHPNVYFCSASDGSNVVHVFQTCLEAAKKYKEDAIASGGDFQEAVMETLKYFDEKKSQEQSQQQELKEQPRITQAK